MATSAHLGELPADVVWGVNDGVLSATGADEGMNSAVTAKVFGCFGWELYDSAVDAAGRFYHRYRKAPPPAELERKP